MPVFAQELRYQDPASLFQQCAGLPYALFIDSADAAHEDARYSYILINPIEIIETRGAETTITNGERLSHFRDHDPFALADLRLKASGFAAKSLPDLPPFQGGLAGLLGYGLIRQIEHLPAPPSHHHGAHDSPDMALGLYDMVISFDTCARKSWLVIQAKNTLESQMKEAVMRHNMCLDAPCSAPLSRRFKPLAWQAECDEARYSARVRAAQDYIRAGDIFQVNLSHRLTACLPQNFSAYDHYCQMRSVCPAPFAGYFNLGDSQIASASPERFLQVNQSGRVSTKPIKGTAPRHPDPRKDQDNADLLKNSEKDRAENIMITDLLRNDLSKVAYDESVQVDQLCALESFSHIHHLVSTISAQIKPAHSAFDLLRGAFPGGSITGAPKLRAVEIIDDLEDHARGPYCGSFILAGSDGSLDSSILIRTLTYKNDTACFNVGGGITALSDPAQEYLETLDKAEGLLASFRPLPHRKTRDYTA